jgi:hypothetical protein
MHNKGPELLSSTPPGVNRNTSAVVIRFCEAHWEDEEQIRRVGGS